MIGPVEGVILLLLVVGLAVVVVRLLGARRCPRCGKRVKRGQLDCPHCDFDFRTIGS